MTGNILPICYDSDWSPTKKKVVYVLIIVLGNRKRDEL